MTPEKHLERGRACLEKFDVEGAQKHFYRANEISGKDPAIRKAVADIYQSFGWGAFDLPGRAEDLWNIFQNARALYESLGEGYEFPVAMVCRGLSLTASKLGDRETAIDYRKISERWCRKARIDPIVRDNHLAKLMNDRVITLHKLGRIDEAAAVLAETLKLIDTLGVHVKDKVVANTLTSRGILLVEQKRPKAAIPYLEKAIEITRKEGEGPVRIAKKRLWLVEALVKAGRLKEARSVLHRAERELTSEGMPNYRLHDFRAMIHLAEGKRQPAIRCLEKALEVIEADSALIDTDEFRASFHGTVQSVYRLLFRLRVSDDEEGAFAVSEAARSRSFLDQLSTEDRRDFSALRPNDRRRMETKRGLMDALAEKKDPKFKKAEAEFRMLLRRYQKTILAGKRVQPKKPVDAKGLCGILAPDEALVSYFADDQSVYAFVARRDGIRLRTLSRKRKALAEDVGTIPAVIRASQREWSRLKAEPVFDWAFRDLYRLLWKPIAKDVGKARRVVVVPCDFLHPVPFPALRDGEDCLADRHELTTMPSASVYAELRKRTSSTLPKNPKCLLVKDPTETLSHVQEEEEVLREIYKDRLTILQGADATEPAFRREAGRHDVIHIASHARFLPGRPEFSHFMLAPMQRYRALDVERLRLQQCRLVVLSACESGMSSPMGSDEMFGLPRSFLAAGVDCVVATLWRVEDHPKLARLVGDIHRRELGIETRLRREGMPASVWAAFNRFGS